MTVLGVDVAREAGSARVDADAGDEPGVDGARFGGQADLGFGAGDLGLRAVDDGLELLEGRVGPDGIAFRGVLGIWRGDIADGDQVGKIRGARGRGEEPGDVVGGERSVGLDRWDRRRCGRFRFARCGGQKDAEQCQF